MKDLASSRRLFRLGLKRAVPTHCLSLIKYFEQAFEQHPLNNFLFGMMKMSQPELDHTGEPLLAETEPVA